MSRTAKTILVTGASGGIGTAVCERLAAAGYSLLCVARDGNRLEKLCSRLSATHQGNFVYISTDMTAEASIAEFADHLRHDSVHLDGVVLMPPQEAPTSDPMPTPEKWREIFQNSFIGPLALLKAALAAMSPDPANGKRAKIVIISGISSAQVLGHYATSNVVRLAWLAQAKTLAFALGPKGIHINTLSLGGTLTPKYSASLQTRAEKAGLSLQDRMIEETDNVPLKKYGTPEEVAGAVEALLSDFSDHISGVNIMHDGGFTRAY